MQTKKEIQFDKKGNSDSYGLKSTFKRSILNFIHV